MNFNLEVDLILCINLKRRRDRLERCMELFERTGIEAVFIEAVDASELQHECSFFWSSSRYACLISHVMALCYAKKHCVNAVLILEDDVEINPHFRRVLRENQVPDDAKVLFLGGKHRKAPAQVSGNVHRCTRTTDNHAYIVWRDAIPEVARCMSNPIWPIDYSTNDSRGCPNKDVLFSRMQRGGQVYGMVPNLMWQVRGFSDNNQRECGNYNLAGGPIQ